MRPLTRPLTLAALLASTIALAACGSDENASTSDGAVLDRDALAQDLSIRLSDAAGGESPEVQCPGDLPVKQGLTMRCTAVLKGQTYGLTVTVTGTENDSAAYDVEVDPSPQQ